MSQRTKILGKFASYAHLRDYILSLVLSDYAKLYGYSECVIENMPFTYPESPIRLICDGSDIGGFSSIREAIDWILGHSYARSTR